MDLEIREIKFKKIGNDFKIQLLSFIKNRDKKLT